MTSQRLHGNSSAALAPSDMCRPRADFQGPHPHAQRGSAFPPDRTVFGGPVHTSEFQQVRAWLVSYCAQCRASGQPAGPAILPLLPGAVAATSPFPKCSSEPPGPLSV